LFTDDQTDIIIYFVKYSSLSVSFLSEN